MELRHIRYFLAVAAERNFSRAAARVGIGQPPLSQQIKDLETEIGAPLFHRVAHGAELTAAGRAFLETVRDMPAAAERAAQAARRAARGETGSLRLGFSTSASFNEVVASTIRAFRGAYPEVALTLVEDYSARLVAGLGEGALDAAFIRPDAAAAHAFKLKPLPDEPLVVALPARHRAAGRKAIDLALLKDDPFLLFPREMGPGLYDIMVGICRAAGFEPKIGQMAPQLASAIMLVAGGMGVLLVPASLQQIRVKGVAFRPIAGLTPTVPLVLAHRGTDGSAIVRNFVTLAGQ